MVHVCARSAGVTVAGGVILPGTGTACNGGGGGGGSGVALLPSP